MKCMNKQARNNKAKFETEREQARFDSLTPEEQDQELAERAVRAMRAKKALVNACCVGSMLSLGNSLFD